MDSNRGTAKTIDEYIADFPEDIRDGLQKIRMTIHNAAPEAEEAIKYAMPTFILQGNLVHFAAFKSHYGFYPTPSGTEQFQAKLSAYKRAKGSVQFPFDQPIPFDLITQIVTFRVKENLERADAKRKNKKAKGSS